MNPIFELRQQAENMARNHAANLDALSHDDVKALAHELYVHQIELEMQNDELRRTHTELQESRQQYAALYGRYANLYDFAPVGYCTLTREGVIVEANLTFAAQLGIPKAHILNTQVYRFIASEDRDLFFLHLRSLFENQGPATCEISFIAQADTAFPAQVETMVVEENATLRCRMAVMDITARKQAEKQLRASLREKEVLLKEIHHRVKNNLQIVTTLLHMQLMKMTDTAATQTVLKDLINRISSMAAIHEQLCQSENLANIPFDIYIRNVAASIVDSYQTTSAAWNLVFDLKPVSLTINESVPCTLIVNELLSNALKYAFPDGRAGEIRIGLHEQENLIVLQISDNGVGLPEGSEQENAMGLKIVSGLARQLRGDLAIERINGATFTLTFPKP